MDMQKYLAALQAKEATQQANFGNDSDTVLGMLCSTYYEQNCNQDTDEVKQAFDELYQAMTGKTLKEQDEVIYATCRLCSGLCRHTVAIELIIINPVDVHRIGTLIK